MTDKIGTVRREEFDGGFSLFILMQQWKENDPFWRCVYSTAPENVGVRWFSDNGTQQISDHTKVVGGLPGTEGFRPGLVTCPVCGRTVPVTKTGKIRAHDDWSGMGKSFCGTGGFTVEAAIWTSPTA